MGNYSIWQSGTGALPGTSGPANGTAFGSAFLSGTFFMCTTGGTWLNGYYYWCAPGTNPSPTTPQKFALWAVDSNIAQHVVPGSVVTSGTLSGGWNYIPLPNPVNLCIGTGYVASTGFTGNFSDTNNYWGPSQPGAAGLVSGPLTAFSAQSGTNAGPFTIGQGLFSTAGSDPSVNMPNQVSGTDNFWVDVNISDTAPAGYPGPYRIWPTNPTPPTLSGDSAVNYDISTTVVLSQACTVSKIWVLSPSGSVTLPTAINIWQVTGSGLTGTLVATNASPSWSGAAGSGWVSSSFSTPAPLPPGTYKISTYNANGTSGAWGAKVLYYWNAEGQGQPFYESAGVNGILNGPVFAPPSATAPTSNDYDSTLPGNTPPYSNGNTEPGQSTFYQAPGGGDGYPSLYVGATSPGGPLAQAYMVDAEFTPFPPPGTQAEQGKALLSLRLRAPVPQYAAIPAPPPPVPAPQQSLAFLQRRQPQQRPSPQVPPPPQPVPAPQHSPLLIQRGMATPGNFSQVPAFVPPPLPPGQPQASPVFLQRGMATPGNFAPGTAVAPPVLSPGVVVQQAAALLRLGLPQQQAAAQAVQPAPPVPAPQQALTFLQRGTATPGNYSQAATVVPPVLAQPGQQQAVTLVWQGLPQSAQGPQVPLPAPPGIQQQNAVTLIRLGLPTPGNFGQAPPVAPPVLSPGVQAQQSVTFVRLGMPVPGNFLQVAPFVPPPPLPAGTGPQSVTLLRRGLAVPSWSSPQITAAASRLSATITLTNGLGGVIEDTADISGTIDNISELGGLIWQ